MKLAIVYSGGLDSTVLLYKAQREHVVECAVSVDYSQRHARELQAALAITRNQYIPHLVICLEAFGHLLSRSSQTNKAIQPPKGHYADESMRVTVVPNRNMILLALTAAIAIDRGCDAIAYGAHAGDHAIYPDCRQEFVDVMKSAFALCDYNKEFTLWAPFLGKTKADIVKEGHKLGVPFEKTYSCYNGRELHCGLCGTCTERREAFQLAGVKDPTIYET